MCSILDGRRKASFAPLENGSGTDYFHDATLHSVIVHSLCVCGIKMCIDTRLPSLSLLCNFCLAFSIQNVFWPFSLWIYWLSIQTFVYQLNGILMRKHPGCSSIWGTSEIGTSRYLVAHQSLERGMHSHGIANLRLGKWPSLQVWDVLIVLSVGFECPMSSQWRIQVTVTESQSRCRSSSDRI